MSLETKIAISHKTRFYAKTVVVKFYSIERLFIMKISIFVTVKETVQGSKPTLRVWAPFIQIRHIIYQSLTSPESFLKRHKSVLLGAFPLLKRKNTHKGSKWQLKGTINPFFTEEQLNDQTIEWRSEKNRFPLFFLVDQQLGAWNWPNYSLYIYWTFMANIWRGWPGVFVCGPLGPEVFWGKEGEGVPLLIMEQSHCLITCFPEILTSSYLCWTTVVGVHIESKSVLPPFSWTSCREIKRNFLW